MKARGIIPWFILALFIFALSRIANGQDCCFNPVILNVDDTTFIQKSSQIYLLESEANQEWRWTIKREKVIPITIVNNYDNVDAQILYFPTSAFYNGETTADATNKTIAYGNIPNSSITFQFTGNRIEWLSEFKTSHGRASVKIDSNTPEIINLGSANTGFGVVRAWDLPKGFHTVVITVLDNKYVIHDGFRITSN